MKLNRKELLVISCLILFVATIIPLLVACEPIYEIKIENGTEQVLTIYYDFGRSGSPRSVSDVELGEHIYTHHFWLAESYCQIDAENGDGEVIFSREYYWEELHEMDWEVVITTPEED